MDKTRKLPKLMYQSIVSPRRLQNTPSNARLSASQRKSAAGPKIKAFCSEAFRHMDNRGHFSMIVSRK